jgi:hypothetical protein
MMAALFPLTSVWQRAGRLTLPFSSLAVAAILAQLIAQKWLHFQSVLVLMLAAVLSVFAALTFMAVTDQRYKAGRSYGPYQFLGIMWLLSAMIHVFMAAIIVTS